jgi:membrane fusion protein (multidrug efflux system)
MKRKFIVTDRLITRVTAWIAGIIVVALSIWGVIFLWKLYNYEETNDAQVQEYINPVISRAGGFIVELKFEENQDVKKGDTLLLIDNREYVIQQAQTEASLQNARAQIRVLESNVQTMQEVSEADSAEIDAAKAKVWKQDLDYNRFKKLYEVESATLRQLEDIKAALDIANAEYKSVKENYEASLSKINDYR